jgi:hypothetical protein
LENTESFQLGTALHLPEAANSFAEIGAALAH